MKHDIQIEHNFETAHRLPVLPGKCQNIHGHSWVATIYIEGVLNEIGIIAEFGKVKALIRQWIDHYLDHGAMLGWEDPLRDAFLNDGSKVFWFGDQSDGNYDVQPGYAELPWPTVEAVAVMLGNRLAALLDEHNLLSDNTFGISQVDISETSVNGAGWGAR